MQSNMKLEEDFSRQKAIDADQRMSSRHSHNVGYPPRMSFPEDTRLSLHKNAHDTASSVEDFPFAGFAPVLQDEFTSKKSIEEAHDEESETMQENDQVVIAARAMITQGTSKGLATSDSVLVSYLLPTAVVMIIIGVLFSAMPQGKNSAKRFRGSSQYGSRALNTNIDKLLNYV